jgi:protein gp37
MGDLFQPEMPSSYIDDILDVMQEAPQHNYFVLTKQPDRIDEMLYDVTEGNPCRELGGGDFLPNLWIGVSVEKQSLAEWRVPPLLKAWPGHKFVSCEPLQGPIELSSWLRLDQQRVEWVIVGAETPRRRGIGYKLRSAVRDLERQCEAKGVPVFMKNNLGPWPEGPLLQEFPKELRK